MNAFRTLHMTSEETIRTLLRLYEKELANKEYENSDANVGAALLIGAYAIGELEKLREVHK